MCIFFIFDNRFYPFEHCSLLRDCSFLSLSISFLWKKNKARTFSFVYIKPPKCKVYVPVMKTNLVNVQALVLSVLLAKKLIIAKIIGTGKKKKASQFW